MDSPIHPKGTEQGAPMHISKALHDCRMKTVKVYRKVKKYQESNKQGTYLLLNHSPAFRRSSGRTNGLNTGIK